MVVGDGCTSGVDSVVDPREPLHSRLDHSGDGFLARNVDGDDLHFDSLVHCFRLVVNESLGLRQTVGRPVTECDFGASFRSERDSCCTADTFSPLAVHGRSAGPTYQMLRL